jgi:hypothetical protein
MDSHEDKVRAAERAVVEAAMADFHYFQDGRKAYLTEERVANMKVLHKACVAFDALRRPLTALEVVERMREALAKPVSGICTPCDSLVGQMKNELDTIEREIKERGDG